ncbi:MAG TPA: hypothetical protein VFP84_31990 [Kofleriaceae bacterium]|nr:hypothetical protein [Kofleriaceae bacterium]
MTRLVAVVLAGAALTACAAPMVVGPYVKSVTRVGDALSVVSCTIVLEGRDFYDGECSSQVIPLSRPARKPDAPPPTGR